MRIDRIQTMLFLLMLISSVASMFWILQIDGTVKSLSQYGLKYNDYWSGPYSKFTTLTFALLLANTVAASYGLFFKGRAKPELTGLGENIHQEGFEKTEKKKHGEKERSSDHINTKEEQAAITEILIEAPTARENAMVRIKKKNTGFFAKHKREPLKMPVEEQEVNSDIESEEDGGAPNLGSLEGSDKVLEKNEPVIEDPSKPASNEQEAIENTVTAFACPSCTHTFSKPLLVLDFSSGKAQLINVCPYCRCPLGE